MFLHERQWTPVTCQIRIVDFNVPSDIVLPFTEVIRRKISVTSTNAFRKKLSKPKSILGNRDMWFISINSNEYMVWTSRLEKLT